jgi:lysyl-tRNA synthetase, class II
MANKEYYENKEMFSVDVTKIKRGDWIGVRGHPARANRNELSIVPKKMELLSPCLRALPHYHGLKDKVRR